MTDERREGCTLGIDTKLYLHVPRRKGVNTEIENVKDILTRPKVTGEEGIGACVSLRVGRIE